MDDRLEKALKFGEYAQTINNQKQNIKNRLYQQQLVHHNNGVFLADPTTISFLQTLIIKNAKINVLIDTKENPIEIDDLDVFLDILIKAYKKATTEFNKEFNKIKKSRNIDKIMDW